LQQNKQPIDVEATQFEPWFHGGKKKCKNAAFLTRSNLKSDCVASCVPFALVQIEASTHGSGKWR